MRGTYTVILACRRSMRVRFGKLGSARMKVGNYLYTGSALGRGAMSLEGRLMRHGRSWKRKKWHVDYLTSLPEFGFKGAVYLISNKRLECRINASIRENLSVQSILPHLGASDCKCDGHLIRVASHLGETKLRHKLERVYSGFGHPQLCSWNLDCLTFFPSLQEGVPKNSD